MKVLLVLFFLLCCIVVPAQKKGQPLIDSMLLVLPTLKNDSNKVNHILAMSKQYYYLSKMDKGIVHLKEALSLAEKINWEKGIAQCYNDLGTLVNDTGNTVQGRIYMEKSLALNREADAKLSIIKNLNNIGRSYQFESDYSRAANYFFDALKLAEEIKSNETIALIGTNITATYLMQENYSKAEEYAKMTLKNAEIAKALYHKATSLQHLGIIFSEKKDTVGARDYFNKAAEVYRTLGVLSGEIESMFEISSLERPEKALKTKLEIQDKLDKESSLFLISVINLTSIGTTYFELAKSKTGPVRKEYILHAERYLRRSIDLARETKSIDNVATASRHLSEVEEEKGNFKEALALTREYHAISDSLYSQESKNQIAALESKKTVDLKDKEIQINKLAISNQRKTQLGLITGLFLLGVIGAMLFWQNKTRKKRNTTLMVLNNQLGEANKVKARFFGILSHDLRSPIVNLVHFLHLQKNNPDLLNEQQQAIHRQNIINSADDLLNTMEAMLLWSKEQMENFRPNKKDILVSDLFSYIQKFFGQTEHVTITYQQPGGLQVSTDENYLRTIMQNLTSNAIRALKNTPAAAIVWNAKQEGDKTILSITDNGPGIEAEQAKALFDDSVVSNEKNGFGLHLIRDLAKAIQYKIAVESEPGRGATFVLSDMAA
jgi:nitrogen-specific signal transduction histidine kinase